MCVVLVFVHWGSAARTGAKCASPSAALAVNNTLPLRLLFALIEMCCAEAASNAATLGNYCRACEQSALRGTQRKTPRHFCRGVEVCVA